VITRAQAEALLNLAEALEVCAAVGVHLRPGTRVVWVTLPDEEVALEDGCTGMSVRLFVSARVPKSIGS